MLASSVSLMELAKLAKNSSVRNVIVRARAVEEAGAVEIPALCWAFSAGRRAVSACAGSVYAGVVRSTGSSARGVRPSHRRVGAKLPVTSATRPATMGPSTASVVTAVAMAVMSPTRLAPKYRAAARER